MVAVEALIASAVIKILSSQMEQFIANEYTKFVNADKTFSDLCTSFFEANRLLQLMDYSMDNKFIQLQLDTLYRICYDVDDLLNDIFHRIEKKKQNSASLHRKPVLNFGKSFKNLKMPRNIQELLNDVDAVKKNLKTNLESNGVAKVASMEVAYGFNQLESMGRDETAATIIKELTSQPNSQGVSLIGIRGIGKRALAYKIIYSNEVLAEFPLILKASMSGNSSNIMTDLNLEVLCDNISKNVIEQCDQKNLRLLLKRDKWLLWMNDMSYIPLMEWNTFRDSHPANGGNRKFLITTLNPDVAKTTKTSPYYLKALSDNCCQTLISEALNNCIPRCSVSHNIIEDLSKQCFGLPSVAYFIAKVLDKNGGSNLHHELWHLPEFKKELFPHLTSSFKSLEPHIVKCFTYLSLFPQDYKFDAEDLTLLWVGEGLAEARGSNPKNHWRDCFDGLLNSSILQPVTTNDSDTSSRYEMQKFTHTFVQLTAPKIYLWLTNQNSSGFNVSNNVNTCHLSLSRDILQPDVWDKIKKLKCLRTFLSLYSGKTGQLNKIPRNLFTKLPRLRVLVLKNTDIKELPSSIGTLKFLCHLDISDTHITRLTEDICNLNGLKIFKFKKPKTHSDDNRLQLPSEFSNLTNLVYLDWKEGDIKSLELFPKSIGKLINLQTLPLFIVGEKEGYRVEELQKMEHLQGSLRITNLENVWDGEQAKKAKISEKLSLQRLELEWTKSKSDSSSEWDVLNGLKPHDGLMKLHIINYGFCAFPEWFTQPSVRLEKVYLKGCNTLPPLGQFVDLKAIHLEGMNSLTSIDNLYSRLPKDCLCFRKLKSLELNDMEVLRDLTELGTKSMPCLRKIKIKNCPKLERLPSLIHLSLLEFIKIEDCEALSSLPEVPPSLKTLIIGRSSLLATSCQCEGWLSKVSNELKILIDGFLLIKPTRTTALSNPPQQGSSSLSQTLRSILSTSFRK